MVHDWVQPAKVLVAEDDPRFCADLVERLVTEGYQVLQTSDGTQALRLARQHQPDAVFLDLTLPGTPPVEVLWQLRTSPETRGSVVVLGADEQTRPFEHERRAADGVVFKPCSGAATLRQINRALARRPQGAEGPPLLGPLAE